MKSCSSHRIGLAKPNRSSSSTCSATQKIKPSRVAPLAAAIATVCFPSIVHAATATWTGGAGDPWDTSATNWSNVTDTPWDATNGVTNAAVFNTASAAASVGDFVYVNSLTFSQTAAITGGTITLAGATPTITTNANATISSILAGSAGLAKAGGSTLTLSGSNTFSGGVTVNAGALQLNNASALGTGTLTINSGAANPLHFNLGSSGTVANAISVNRAVYFYQDANNNLTVSGNITANGNRISFYPNTGVTSGTITLSGSNSFTNSAIGGGGLTLRLATTNAQGSMVWRPDGTLNLVLLDGVNFNQTMGNSIGSYGMDTSGTAAFNGDFNGASSINTAAGAQLSFNGYYRGGGTFVKTGPGTAIFTRGDGMSVTLSGGVFQVPSMAAINSGTTYVTTLDGGTFRYAGSGDTATRPLTVTANGGTLDAAGTGAVTFSSTAAVTYTGSGNRTLTLTGTNTGANTLAASIADNGTDVVSLVKSGTGTWVLSGSNSYSGGTQINAGVLSVTGANSLPTSGVTVSGSATLTVGTAVTDATVTSILSGTSFASGASFGYDTTAGNRSAGSNIGGALNLLKIGANTLTLTGSSTFSGGFAVNAGALQINHPNALGTGTLTINSGANALHFNLPTSGTVANSIVTNTPINFYLDASNNLTLAGNIVPNANLAFYPNTPAISGTITFTGSNSFAGNYFCSGTNLTLRFGSTNSPGNAAWWPDASAKIILLNGVTFNSTLVPQGSAGQTFTIGMDASGTATFAGRIYTAAAGVPTDIDVAAGAQLTLSGPFSGSGTYIKTGAGTAIVSNGGDAIEAFVVSGGVLQASTIAPIATSGSYGTTLNGGTLQYTGASGTTSRPLTITANGGAFDASGSGPITYSSTSSVLYTGSGNRTLNLIGSNTGQNTLATTIADSGTGTVALAKSGEGTWVLSSSNSYSGGTVVSNGVLLASNANALGTGAATVNGGALEFPSPWWTSIASVVVNSGGALGLAVGGSSGFMTSDIDTIFNGGSGAVLNSGALVALDPVVSGTYGSVISGSVGVQKIGSNALVLSSANTYLGATKLSAGALNSVLLADGGQPSSIGASTNAASNLVLDGGTLQYTGSSVSTDRQFTLTANGGALDASGSSSVTFSSTASVAFTGSGNRVLTLTGTNTGLNTLAASIADSGTGTVALVKSGAGTWVLTGSNSYSGGTQINAGVLNLGNANAIGTTGTISFGGGTLQFSGSNSADYSSRFSNAATQAFNLDTNGQSVTLANALTSSGGSLTKAGAGTLVLAANSAYTGATSITGGTLQIGNSGTTGSIATTSSVSISSGATLAFSRTDNQGGNFTKVISGAGGLALNSGTLTLIGSNSYNGATAVSSGAVLQVGDGSSGLISGTGWVTVNAGGTFTVNLANSGTLGSFINAIGGAVNFVGSGTNTIGGQISGYDPGTVNQNGTGTTILANTNQFRGTININAGILQLNLLNSALNSTINVGSSGSLTFGTNVESIGGLSGSGSVVLQTGTNGVALTIGGNNQNTVFAGTLSGTNGALTMAGTNNVLTLAGLNTYTGSTNVTSGTLQIGNGGTTGSIASSGSIAISSGATLAFNRSDDYGGAFSQPVTGAGRMLISSGSLTISSTSAFTGDLVLASGGTVVPGVAAPLPGANLDGEGGTLNLGPMVSASFGGLKGAGNLNVVSTSGSALTLNVGGNNQTTAFSGSLSGSNLSLTKAGTGTLTLSGSSSFTGGVTLANGALTLWNEYALGNGGALTITEDADIGLNFNLPTSGTVSNAITFTKPGGPHNDSIIQNANNNLTLAGNINAAGHNLIFNSATGITSGTFTLTGSNSFGGLYTSGTATFRIGNSYAAGGAVWRPSVAANIILLDGVNFGSTVGNSIASYGMDTSGTAAFTADIDQGSSAPVNTPAGAQLSFTGVDRGNGAILKTGAGTAIFTNQYNYGMPVTISGGVIQVSNMAAIDGYGTSGTAGYFTTLDSGTLRYVGGSVATARPLAITANGGALDASGAGALNFSSTAAVTYTGSGNRTLTLTGTNTGTNTLAASIADNGADIVSLAKTGAGTWVLSGSNSYSGETQVNAGVLNLGSADAIGATGTISFGGGTLQFSGSNTTDYSSQFSNAAGQVYKLDTNGQTVTLASGLTSSGGSLTKTGTGTLTLTGSNSYTGSTTANSGTLALGPSAVLSSATSSLNLGGAALDLGTTSQTVGAVAITAAAASGDTILNGTLSGASFAISNTSGTAVFSANLAGSAAMTKSGGGALLLSGSNTFSGGVTVSAGALQVNNANALGSGTLTVNSGASQNQHFNLGGDGTVPNAMQFNRTVSIYQDGNNNLTLSGNIASNGNQIQFFPNTGVTSGTITLTGSNSFSNSYISGDNLTIRLGNNYALGTMVVRPASSLHLILLNGVTYANTIGNSIASYGMDTSGTATFTGDLGQSTACTVNTPAGAQLTINSVFRGNGAVTKTGSGTAIFTNQYNYGMPLTISSGVIQVSNMAAIDGVNMSGTAGFDVTTLDGGTLRYAGGTGSTARQLTITANGGSYDASGSGPVTFSSTGAVIYTGSGNRSLTLTGTNTGSNTLAAPIADNGADVVSLAKTGAGAWVLTGSSSYSGGTTVNNGTLKIGNANALGTGGLTVNGGALDLNGQGIAVGALGGAGGSITNSAMASGTLTTTVVSGTSSFAGSIANGTGAVALTKAGAGTIVLSGSLSMAGLNANEGGVQITQSGSIGALTVSGSGAITLTSHTGGNPYTVIETSSLSITSGGSIDLWNNAMILRASGTSENAANLTTVKAAVNAASNGLRWNGMGIGSTTAFNEAQPGKTQALALMVYDNTVIAQSSFEGVSGLGYFDSGSPVGFNQVLVKLTYLGDFNADGVINASDYTWLDGFALSGNVLGDLNGDGVVNATDYTWLDGSALNQSFGVLAGVQGGVSTPLSPALATAFAGAGSISASPETVPEPGTFGLFLASAMGLLGFRRKTNGSRENS